MAPALFINDPEHWQTRAQEARKLAEQMNDGDARQAMLRIADEYEKLAQRARDRSQPTCFAQSTSAIVFLEQEGHRRKRRRNAVKVKNATAKLAAGRGLRDANVVGT